MKKIVIVILLVYIVIVQNHIIVYAFDDEEERVRKGIEFINTFEFDKALKIFREITINGEQKDYLYFYLGEASRLKLFYAKYKELSKSEETELINESEMAFSRCLTINPYFNDARVGLGKLYIFNREYKKALNVYLTIERIGAANKVVYKDMSIIYDKLNRPDMSKLYNSLSRGKENNIPHKLEDYNFEKKDNIKVGKYNYTICSTISWSIKDIDTYLHNYINVRMYENIIYDVFIGSLVIEANLNNFNDEFVINDEFRIKLMERVNGMELASRGIMVTNFIVTIENPKQ